MTRVLSGSEGAPGGAEACGLDQSAEQRRVRMAFGGHLRVPLHPESKRMGGLFDRLDQPLVVLRRHIPARAGARDRLVVARVHGHAVDREQPRDACAAQRPDLVAHTTAVFARAGQVLRQVLVEVAAVDQREQLHAIAHTEHGQAALQRRTRELNVEILFFRWHGCREGMGRALAEPRHVEVVTTGQQDAVEPRQEVHHVPRAAARINADGRSAGSQHGLGVAQGQVDPHAAALAQATVDADPGATGQFHGGAIVVPRCHASPNTFAARNLPAHGASVRGTRAPHPVPALVSLVAPQLPHPVPVHEPAWLLLGIYLVAGFVLLAKGADWLVGGSAGLARRLGISSLAIGLTVVAWGTSAPELVVSVLAALEGQAAISLGNVLGSNIANIGLVLGACALVLPRVLEGKLSGRDLFWLFASVGALWWACSDGDLSRLDAVLLLLLFAVYNVVLWRGARRFDDGSAAAAGAGAGAGAGAAEAEVGATAAVKGMHPALLAFIGVVVVSVGAKLVVVGAEGGALRLGIDARIVGLTVVAVGTSLPELAAGLGSAFRGESDISLGNVLGSNVFNVIAVLGLVGIVSPLTPDNTRDEAAREQLELAFRGALANDFPYVMAFSVAFALLPWLGGARYGRLKGGALILAYAWYTWNLF